MKSFKNILTKNVSKLFSLLLIGVMSLSSSIVYADTEDEISSGIYTLSNETKYLDENEVGTSMSRAYTDEIMTLEKREGKTYYTVGLSGAQYMTDHKIFVNDESIEFEKIEENTEEGTLKLKFEVSHPEDKILIQMYVDAMGRNVEYELVPKLDSLELVEAIEDPEPVVEESTEDKNVDTEVKTSSEQSPMNMSLISGVVILAIAIIFFIFKKKK